ncbi:MAG: hypothetical protein AAFQ68_00780 [Bacteroidota bacterium]
MKNSRLLELLRMLSPKEMRRLDEFVRSPYFNKHLGVLALWEAIWAAYPDFEEEALDREDLAQKLLDQPIRPQQLLDLTSYLTRLVERYLAQERWESDSMQRQEQLVLSLREREALQAHQRSYRKWQRMMPQPATAGELEWQYRIAAEGMHTQLLQRNRKADHRFAKTIAAFDEYYFVNRLRYACAQLNRRDVLATDAHLVWARNIISHLAIEDQASPLLRAYRQLFILLDGQEQDWTQIQHLLTAESEAFTQESLREIYAHLINYAIRKLNEGNKVFQGHVFSLYRDQLDKGTLLEAGVLSPADYKNIVSLGLREGEDQWTEQFIQQYESKLPQHQRRGAYRYQMANLHFYRKEFSDCLRLLREEEFVDPFYQLGARTMILKVHFEQEAFEAFYYACDAFEAFLQRKSQFPSYQKPLYQNLLRFGRRLAKYYIQHRLGSSLLKKAQLIAFHRRLQAHSKIAQLDWLLAKTDQLLHEQGIASVS